MAKRLTQRAIGDLAAASLTSVPIDNRAVIRAKVRAYMRKHHRGDSIDLLLARPCDALRMGIAIALDMGTVRNPGRANHLASDAARYAAQTPGDVDAIHHVLQTAMAARKAGKLRIGDYVNAEGE